MTIMDEGPPFEEYDATSAVLSWYSSKSRRLNQKERKSYKKRESRRQKIYASQSDAESVSLSRLAEHEGNAKFSQSEEEDKIELYWP